MQVSTIVTHPLRKPRGRIALGLRLLEPQSSPFACSVYLFPWQDASCLDIVQNIDKLQRQGRLVRPLSDKGSRHAYPARGDPTCSHPLRNTFSQPDLAESSGPAGLCGTGPNAYGLLSNLRPSRSTTRGVPSLPFPECRCGSRDSRSILPGAFSRTPMSRT